MSLTSTPAKDAPMVHLKMKSRKRNFKKQKQKLFRASEPLISVMMWGVNHTIKELMNMRTPLMLMPDDFKAYSKIKVDNHIFNKENLPSHFKVKEYCPLVFRRLREIFGIEDKDYVNSLCVSAPVRVEDKGRSVARFFHSCDRRFVIKTLTGEDIAEMHGLLPKYHQFIVERKRKTLLPQYLGMYRLTLNGTMQYLIVMRNVFSSVFKAHKKYDLKGSTVQREASQKEKKKEFPTFKDNDFVKDNVKIYLNEEDREEFLSKLKYDVDFLASLKLMDYSLLVGIHDCERPDRYGDHLYGNDESDVAFADGSPVEEESASSIPGSPNGELDNKRESGLLDDELTDSFYGVRTASSAPKPEVYYMGLIDILTHYDTKKKAAHAVKTAKHGYGADFSVKSPRVYAERLLKFIMGRTEGYDSERADGYIVSDTSASGRTFDETMPKETRPLPSARHSAIKCSHSVENLIQGKRNNAVSLERSRSLSFLPHVTTNIALRPLNRRKPGAEISSIQPSQYSKRFYEFICDHVVSPGTSNSK